MNGQTGTRGGLAEPHVTAQDVFDAARHGQRVWRCAEGRTWRLTSDDLRAVDGRWGGDPDDLSPLVTGAIAGVLNWQRPWRAEEDPDRPLAWADGIDTSRPAAARVYDCLLGGSHNWGPDRQLAQQLIELDARAPAFARANRGFLHRAVDHLLAAGVRQFIDVGSGLPTVGPVHEIAQRADPRARVVYVDIDPIAVALGRQIVAGNRYAAVIEVDLRRPEVVLSHPETRRLVDLAEPVGLLMVAVLHFVPDGDDPGGVVARYRRALAPGSYLAVSHACLPAEEGTRAAAAEEAYRATATPLCLRTAVEVAELVAGWRLLPPGLVQPQRWRPDAGQRPWPPFPGVAGVARLDGDGAG